VKSGRGRVARMVAVLAVACACAVSAAAQGMYLKEVEKDGRIYVFNQAAEYERWQASGEMGKGVTKLNYGPNGETAVFDSDDAIDLYNFKHGKSELVVRPPKPRANISYKDGQLTAEFDKGQVTFTNRLQLRYTHQFPDSAVQLPGTAAKGDSKGSFRFRRYEPTFSGWLYTKNLTYKLEFAFQDLQNNAVNGGAINDAFFTYDLTKGRKRLRAQLGQFKVPFGRQEMTSSFNQQLVDRSIVADEYERGRDQGLQLDGLLLGSKLEWRAGLFNGNRRSFTLNDNDTFQYDARVTFQPWGDVKYSESDFESSDHPLLAVAVQFEHNDFTGSVAAPVPALTACPCGSGPLERDAVGVDVVFKYKGLSLYGVYYDRSIDPVVGTRSFDSNGWNLQAGYLLNHARTFEVALRFASWDPTSAVEDNDRRELGAAASWYYNRHFAKVQADFRRVEDRARKTKDHELRIQSQLYF
jgi:phosphate-selective porin OprO and OprP